MFLVLHYVGILLLVRGVYFFKSVMVVEFYQILFQYLLLMTVTFCPFFLNVLLEEYFYLLLLENFGISIQE